MYWMNIEVAYTALKYYNAALLDLNYNMEQFILTNQYYSTSDNLYVLITAYVVIKYTFTSLPPLSC